MYIQMSRGEMLLWSYSEVPNRRADRNKQAGLEKSVTLLAYLLIELINKQGRIFCLLREKSKRACSSIRDFRVVIIFFLP